MQVQILSLRPTPVTGEHLQRQIAGAKSPPLATGFGPTDDLHADHSNYDLADGGLECGSFHSCRD